MSDSWETSAQTTGGISTNLGGMIGNWPSKKLFNLAPTRKKMPQNCKFVTVHVCGKCSKGRSYERVLNSMNKMLPCENLLTLTNLTFDNKMPSVSLINEFLVLSS